MIKPLTAASLLPTLLLLFTFGLLGIVFTNGVVFAAGEPIVVITSQPTSPSNEETPTFQFTVDEPADTYCSLDLGSFEPCTSPHVIVPLAEGAHILQVFASNGDGDGPIASSAWEVDFTQPDTFISQSPDSPTSDLTPEFQFTSDDPGATFQCAIDSGAAAACTSPYTTGTLTAGFHQFEVYATDTAGNTDATPAQFSFEIETGANEFEIQMNSAEDGSLINFIENGCGALGEWSTKKESELALQDLTYSYPLGLVKFQLIQCPVGGTATIQLTFTSNHEPSAVTLRKFNETTNAFTTLTQENSNLHVSRTTQEGKQAILVEYQITDGGLFDQDSVANGEILDPVGLGSLVVGVPNTGLYK